jgi:hypothetical protein
MFDLGELDVGHLEVRAGRSSAAQRIQPTCSPAGVPHAYGLGGDAELAGDLGLADTDGKQLAGAQPAGLQPVTFLLCRRAAGKGCHGRILPGQAGPAPLGPAPSQPDTQDPFIEFRAFR